MDGRTPALHRLPNAGDVHWLPWSPWWMTSPGRRWPTAISGASRTRSARRWSAISRAMRLRPCSSPPARSAACTRGARPGGLARGGVDGPDPLWQRRVGNGMGGRRAMPPGMAAGLRDAGHARHGGDRAGSLVRAHDPADPDGTAPVPRANQAAARERMSRSRRRCLFSRRSPASSSRSVAASDASAIAASPDGGPPAGRPGQPSCGSPGRRARTRGQARPDRLRPAPDRSSDAGTQASRVGEPWASETPLVKA